MIETLFDRRPRWLAGDGPESSIVLGSECTVLRNLGDLPFPARCSEDELHAAEERIRAALDGTDLMTTGRYCPLSTFHSRDTRFLAERRLVVLDLMRGAGTSGSRHVQIPQGAYVAEDQSMSVMINRADHLGIRVLASGLQLQEAWARACLVDDTLSTLLDFAFDDRYGYLTSDLSHVGTGLRAVLVLHLPALSMVENKMPDLVELANERHQLLRGVKPVVSVEKEAPGAGHKMHVCEALYGDLYGTFAGPVSEAVGDMYMLSNVSTLGVSEEEILFHVRHVAEDLIEKEKKARRVLREERRPWLEDRVWRAVGLAANARMLGFVESLVLLSSIRLGVSLGLLENHSFAELNRLLLDSQSVHLEIQDGQECDELALSMKRADLFRRQIAG